MGLEEPPEDRPRNGQGNRGGLLLLLLRPVLLRARLMLQREELDRYDPFQPRRCTAVPVRLRSVCQPPPNPLRTPALQLPSAPARGLNNAAKPLGPVSLPPPPWVGTSALLLQEGCRDVRWPLLGLLCSLARLPPSLLLLGSSYRDKRSACSCRDLFCLRELLTGVGSADCVSRKIVTAGSQRSPRDGRCPHGWVPSASVLLCLLLWARWGRGQER